MIFCHSLHSWTTASEFLSNVDGLPLGDWRAPVGPCLTVIRIIDYSQRNQLIFFPITSYSAAVLKDMKNSSLCFVILEKVVHYVKSNYNSEKNNSKCEMVKYVIGTSLEVSSWSLQMTSLCRTLTHVPQLEGRCQKAGSLRLASNVPFQEYTFGEYPRQHPCQLPCPEPMAFPGPSPEGDPSA